MRDTCGLPLAMEFAGTMVMNLKHLQQGRDWQTTQMLLHFWIISEGHGFRDTVGE